MSKEKKKDETDNEIDVAKKALELAKANAKAIEELKEECRKGFSEHHKALMTLKERNHLR